MATFVQGLRDSILRASSILRRESDAEMSAEASAVPDVDAQDKQLEPVLQAFGLLSFAELKVLQTCFLVNSIAVANAIFCAVVLSRILLCKVVLTAMVLSECVYKLVDVGLEQSAEAAALFANQLPPGLVSISHIQSATGLLPHRSAQPATHVVLKFCLSVGVASLQCLSACLACLLKKACRCLQCAHAVQRVLWSNSLQAVLECLDVLQVHAGG